MARSKPLQEAYKVAEAYSRDLDRRARETGKMDPRFNYSVQIVHDEGTQIFFRNAFVLRWGIWQIVIPEHHDIHIYADDEAQVFLFKMAPDEVEELIDLSGFGVDESELKWGPDPYGTLKRKAEEDAALDAEETSAEPDL